jgi:Ca2+/Na+ antiporter
MIIAVIAALISGGYAYAVGPNIVTGIFAIVGAVCLVLTVISAFSFRSRSSRYSRSAPSSRYGNVTPIRRNPLSSIATRWNLFLLKLRYRRKKG